MLEAGITSLDDKLDAQGRTPERVRHLLRIGLVEPDSAVTSSDQKSGSARQTAVIQGLNVLDTYFLVQYKRATFCALCTRDEGEQ